MPPVPIPDAAAAWTERGRALATKLLAAGVTAFQLSDLRYRFGALTRHFGANLRSLGARPGEEAQTAGVWARHLDGVMMFLTNARLAAENAFNAGWDEVVEGAIRERTRAQRLPGEGGSGGGAPDFLVTLGLDRGCTGEDIKRAYRSLAMGAHPDVGGDHELFITLARARDEALAWVSARDRSKAGSK